LLLLLLAVSVYDVAVLSLCRRPGWYRTLAAIFRLKVGRPVSRQQH